VQPDKSIDVIDEAGARVRIKSMSKPPNLAELEADIERLTLEKDEAVKAADYEKAAELRDQAEQMRKKKEEIQKEWRAKPRRSTASSTRRSSPRSSPR
jgi:ATP-dependent Clp protease ATP-binding subunit ClpC